MDENAGPTRAGAVGTAQPSPLGLLRAYVWPAVALGPAGDLLRTLLASGATASAPLLADASRVLLGVAGASAAGGVAESARSSAAPPQPSKDSRSFPIPTDAQISLVVFIALLTALTASVVLMLRRELRSMHRWPF